MHPPTLRLRHAAEPAGNRRLSSPRALLAIVLMVAAGGVADRALADSARVKYNVLLITADDLSAALGCYGHPQVKTPNLDRLAARAVLFERAYCQFPLCNPSRTSLLTGLRPDTSGVVNNQLKFRDRFPQTVTLPQLFRNNGYYAARVGKLYHMGVPGGVGGPGLDDGPSWDYAISPPGLEHASPGKAQNLTPQYQPGVAFRVVEAEGGDDDQADGRVAAEAVRLLGEKRAQPWFLAVGFVRPHVPLVAPKKYFDLYPLDSIQLPQVPAGDRDDIPAPALAEREPDYGLTPEQCREVLRGYYAAISFLDAQVGRVLKALDDQQLSEKTIVVFLSDHGYHLGEHRLWQKLSLFEPSARVPLLIAAPGMPGNGRHCPRVVELLDVYPTLADCCGLTPPKSVEGKSLRPLLEDPAQAWNSVAHTQVRRGKSLGRSVRNEKWRYTEWDEGRSGRELYDQQGDPAELHNLADNLEHDDVVKMMQGFLGGTP
ncbi:MAG: sulfatase [Planctomycetaceae bacterium]|nr:sulfatase [Planctomycetaceae bacterium]